LQVVMALSAYILIHGGHLLEQVFIRCITAQQELVTFIRLVLSFLERQQQTL